MTIRTATAFAIVGLAAAALAAGASAQQNIRPGKWDFTANMDMSGMQVPAGIQLPPNVHPRPGGMTVNQTSCIDARDPTAQLRNPQGPGNENAQCRVDKIEQHGDTITWANSCTMPDGKYQTTGWARFSGDRMEAQYNGVRTGMMGSMDSKVHVTGRYIGPCSGR